MHNGRIVQRTGDGSIIEFRSVVDAVRCAIEVQNAMVERNAGVPEDRRIVFRIGVHLGDVVEESDGDLGDGVGIAARLEGIAEPGAISLSEDAYRQVKGRLDLAVTDLGATRLKNITEPIRAYSLQVGVPAGGRTPAPETKPPEPKKHSTWASLAAGIAGSAGRDCVGRLVFPVRKPIDDRRDERARACRGERGRARGGRAGPSERLGQPPGLPCGRPEHPELAPAAARRTPQVVRHCGLSGVRSLGDSATR